MLAGWYTQPNMLSRSALGAILEVEEEPCLTIEIVLS